MLPAQSPQRARGASAMSFSPSVGAESIGRVVAVTGCSATIELTSRSFGEQATVGKFVGLAAAKVLIVGLVTEVSEDGGAAARTERRRIAQIDLTGEIGRDGRFQRGVTEYPNIGDGASLLSERELRQVYGAADGDHAQVGDLQQNLDIPVHIDV